MMLPFWNRWDFDSHEDGEVGVWVLGPDAAVAKLVSNIAMTDTAGVHREWQFNQAMLMVREAGEWKLVVAKNAPHRGVVSSFEHLLQQPQHPLQLLLTQTFAGKRPVHHKP